MRLRLLQLVPALAVALLTLSLGGQAHADSYSNSNLIDDSIFVNAGTMNQNDIQNFLNGKGGALASQSFATPSNGNQSAAWIIYYVSQHVGINPQTIMATMQKEESLITLTATPSQDPANYNFAMGYGCPDSGGCSESGFWDQVIDGSWQLRFDYERAGGNNSYWTAPDGTQWGAPSISYPCPSATRYYNTGLYAGRSVTFSNDAGTGYATFTLANRSTAALYCYTPHAYTDNPPVGGQYYSGSYNFVQSFISWWGNVHVPSYSWQVVSQSYSSGGIYINSTDKETLTLVVQNTGSTTWYNSGANPVKLGTDDPQERASQFADPSWPAPNRPAVMQQASVAPGSNATFTFIVQAPGPGTYQEHFNLLAEGLSWFNDPGMYFYFQVNPATYSAQYVSDTFPASLGTSQTQSVTFTYKNTGNTTWYKSGLAPVKLGDYGQNSLFADSSWESPQRAATMNEASAPPGTNATFTFLIDAPPITGSYTDSFEPVVEGWAWIPSPAAKTLQATSTYLASANTQNTSLTMVAGQTSDQVVSYTNSGSATWSSTAAPQLKLGTAAPFGRSSIFTDPSWPSYNRPSIMNEASVAPGGTGTFNLRLHAPLQPGIYSETFAPVAEGLTWVNTPVTYTITVVPASYNWQVVSQSYSLGNTTLSPGQSETVTVQAKNTGNTTWFNNGSSPVKLATTSPQYRTSAFYDSSWLSSTRAALLQQSSVAPGGTGTFSFTINGPGAGGAYQEHFSLVAEGLTWFNDPGMYFTVNVPATYSWQLVSQSYSLGSVNLPAGQTETLTVVARNTGTATWLNTGGFPVKLGTTNPKNRTSAFYNAGWAASNRPAIMTESSVAPGQTGTFSFPITAPSTKGVHLEYLSPLAEGIAWFNDPGMYFYLNVQ